MINRRTFLALCLAFPLVARSQSGYPARPLRFICPYPPGGPTDSVSRIVAARMGELMGQAIVVENRPGANANVGAEAAARSPGDGYTLFLGTGSTHGINSFLYPKLGYDPVKDFAPVAALTESMLFLVVNNALPVKTLQELIAHARANPGRLAYASPGNGSAHHLAMEMLKQRAGLDMTHVPYKGSAPATADLIAGRVQLMFDSAASQIRSGQVRGIATASTRRWPPLAELPSFAEAGMPDFNVGGWFGLFTPAGVPAAIVQRLNAAANDALNSADVRKRIEDLGLRVTGGTPAGLARHVGEELAKWGPVVKASGARVD